MSVITFTYAGNAGNVSLAVDAMSVKGFDPVDDFDIFPGKSIRLLNGDFTERIKVFNRRFTVEVGVDETFANRVFFNEWLMAQNKYLTFTHDSITESLLAVVNASEKVSTTWLDGSELARYIVIECTEKYARAAYPSSSGAVPEGNMYVKKRVSVVGTQASPETFTTGAGKLALCDAPAGAYPTFDLTTTEIIVTLSPYQEGKADFANYDFTVSGGALTFKLALSDGGNPSPDGYFYFDITIEVVSK